MFCIRYRYAGRLKFDQVKPLQVQHLYDADEKVNKVIPKRIQAQKKIFIKDSDDEEDIAHTEDEVDREKEQPVVKPSEEKENVKPSLRRRHAEKRKSKEAFSCTVCSV